MLAPTSYTFGGNVNLHIHYEEKYQFSSVQLSRVQLLVTP